MYIYVATIMAEAIYWWPPIPVPMARKPYRVELIYLTKGKPRYYLVRDVKVKDLRRKIRKYIGIRPPTPIELGDFRDRYAYDMEMRAARKKAELSGEYYRTEYITGPQQVKLTADEYSFGPSSITVTAGQPVPKVFRSPASGRNRLAIPPS